MSVENMAQAETPEATNTAVSEAPAQETQEPKPQNEPQEPVETVESIRKKADNRISRLEKSRAKKDWQLSEQGKQLEALRKEIEGFKQSNQPKNKEPDENDFDNYGDYLKAVARYKPQQENQPEKAVDPKKIEEQAYATAKEAVHYEQRVNHVAQQAQKAMAESPELQQLFADNEDILDSFPPQIEKVFLDADNAPAAFYALTKEGKLELLAQMNPTQAAYTIAQAQIRGEQMMKAAKVSKAPAPITGAKGASQSGKPLGQQSWSELKKNLNLR